MAISGVESGKAAPLVGGPPGTELHTILDGLPSGVVGKALPVVVTTTGVGIVPNGAVGVMAVSDIDDVGAVVVPGMDVELVLPAIDDVDAGVGTGIGLMEGDGRAGTVGGCGAGMVLRGISDMNDVAGCADSVRYVVAELAGAEEVAGTVGVVADADIAVPLA